MKKRFIKIFIGWFFLILGIIGCFFPILQGFLFIGVGLLILADESTFIQKLLQPLKEKYPDKFKKVYEFKQSLYRKLRNMVRRNKA